MVKYIYVSEFGDMVFSTDPPTKLDLDFAADGMVRIIEVGDGAWEVNSNGREEIKESVIEECPVDESGTKVPFHAFPCGDTTPIDSHDDFNISG